MQQKRKFTFGSQERLKHRKKIDRLFTAGQSLSLPGGRLIYYPEQQVGNMPTTTKLLVGVGVSKRYFKKAVDRNRIKRWMREAVRLQKPAVQEEINNLAVELNIFFLYTHKELPDFNSCYELVQHGFHKLLRKLKPGKN